MNDFEMQRRLRGMNGERTPRSDLWPGIAARIAAAEADAVMATPRRRFRLPLAVAAAVLLAISAGVLLQDHREPASMPVAVAPSTTDRHESMRISPREAADIARTRGSDPRVLGASLVLDSAQDELAQALEQRPDAVFLVSLLNRTHAQRMKLERFGASAG
jgi:hypothetical protein